jgi:hypothetical protein
MDRLSNMHTMNKHPDIWQDIETAAGRLGVSGEALRKWKERGVPYRWHNPIVSATGGRVTHDALIATREVSA